LTIKVAVSVLFTAAVLLMPAYATASMPLPRVPGVGYNSPNLSTAIAPSRGKAQETLAVQNDPTGIDGPRGPNFQQSGIAIQGVRLAPTDTMIVYEDCAGADNAVYGLVSEQVNGTRASQPTRAPIQTCSIVAGQPSTVSSSPFHNSRSATDCANTMQAPGPGMFVLVGIGMIGLGMTVRERKRRA